ncbi:MAG: CPBP family intramembrane glutamic endopeptidase [Terracidiphilus sp.]
MEPENTASAPELPSNQQLMPAGESGLASGSGVPTPPARGGIGWVFIGPLGLRAGWSVAIFIALLIGLGRVLGIIIKATHTMPPPGKIAVFTPLIGVVSEGASVLAIVIAAWIVSRIERRRLAEYNLIGPRRVPRFFSGIVTGFLALSVLVIALMSGGWLHFGQRALNGSQIAVYAAEWGVVFLLVGCSEEGLARCFLLFEFARGLNYWWSLGLVAVACTLLSLNPRASGLWGMYAIALLGLAPCLLLQLKRAPSTGFWCAAWVTSVLFGAGHTANPGENWIGIFSAAGIGFVFCASVKLTGSVWWAIGCHAGWDWGQTFFYGTPDSGMVAKGHLLTVTSSGSTLWSGGADGPEGSLLVIPTMLLILLVLLVQYGRRRRDEAAGTLAEQSAG